MQKLILFLVLLENGHVHVFGRNKYGELGLGHRQPVDHWTAYRPVKALCAKTCVVSFILNRFFAMNVVVFPEASEEIIIFPNNLVFQQLVCGSGFTTVATGDNELYFWGTRGIKKKSDETITIEDLEIERTASPEEKGKKCSDSSSDKNRSKSAKKHWLFSKNQQSLDDGSEDEICSIPTLVLRLDSTRNSQGNKPFIKLSLLAGNGRRVLCVINTSPNPSISGNGKFATLVPVDNDLGKRRKSAPELQASEVPTWIQNELNDSEVLSYSHYVRLCFFN